MGVWEIDWFCRDRTRETFSTCFVQVSLVKRCNSGRVWRHCIKTPDIQLNSHFNRRHRYDSHDSYDNILCADNNRLFCRHNPPASLRPLKHQKREKKKEKKKRISFFFSLILKVQNNLRGFLADLPARNSAVPINPSLKSRTSPTKCKFKRYRNVKAWSESRDLIYFENKEWHFTSIYFISSYQRVCWNKWKFADMLRRVAKPVSVVDTCGKRKFRCFFFSCFRCAPLTVPLSKQYGESNNRNK